MARERKSSATVTSTSATEGQRQHRPVTLQSSYLQSYSQLLQGKGQVYIFHFQNHLIVILFSYILYCSFSALVGGRTSSEKFHQETNVLFTDTLQDIVCLSSKCDLRHNLTASEKRNAGNLCCLVQCWIIYCWIEHSKVIFFNLSGGNNLQKKLFKRKQLSSIPVL